MSSYIINNSRGNIIAVIPDGSTNTSATSLSLIGQGVTNYGTAENENLVYLLENFASPTAPLVPILGQLWYNSATDALSSYSTGNVWVIWSSQAYVDAQKISPAFSGIPTAPTAANGVSTTQIATTAYVQNQLAADVSVRLPSMTSTQRNALSPVNGDLIYNTTVNYIQGYQANAWVNMTQA